MHLVDVSPGFMLVMPYITSSVSSSPRVTVPASKLLALVIVALKYAHVPAAANEAARPRSATPTSSCRTFLALECRLLATVASPAESIVRTRRLGDRSPTPTDGGF